jgi:magnesium-transporting ATPase (P-type)
MNRLPEGTIDYQNPGKSAGLSEEEATQRSQVFGLNRLTPPPQKPAIIKFLLKFTGNIHHNDYSFH